MKMQNIGKKEYQTPLLKIYSVRRHDIITTSNTYIEAGDDDEGID